MGAQPFLGQIMPVAFGIVPKGWQLCNGALLEIQSNQALFALLGTVYGGDGVRTFALPDLRGRTVLGTDFNTVPWGQIAGTETVTLQTSQLPSHLHNLQASTTTANDKEPTNHLFGVNNTGSPVALIFAPPGSNEVTLSVGTNVIPAGSSAPHNNMQPFLVIDYVIATQGIYPTRP